MSNHEFGGSLYRSQRQMLDAMAGLWLSANGSTSEAAQREILSVMTDAVLAAECIEGWELNSAEVGWPGDDAAQSHMIEQGYDADDLAWSFGRVRELLAGGR